MQEVTEWLHTNKFTVNTGKLTDFFIIKKNGLYIWIMQQTINRKETEKFVGVYINESLSWNVILER